MTGPRGAPAQLVAWRRAALLLAEVHSGRGDLAALFAPDGELRLHREEVGARGPAEIERLMREQWGPETRVLGEPTLQLDGAVAATWGWSRRPAEVVGEVRLAPRGDRIGCLDVFTLPAPKVPRDRSSVRAVIVAPGPEILLFQCGDPARSDRWWIAPGGGREPGEDDLSALRRELLEEVGIPVHALGPCLWTRTHTFVWQDEVLRQHERYFLVPVPAAVEPAPTHTDFGAVGHRWWRPDELDVTDQILVPRRLAELLRAVLSDGPPTAPFDAGL